MMVNVLLSFLLLLPLLTNGFLPRSIPPALVVTPPSRTSPLQPVFMTGESSSNVEATTSTSASTTEETLQTLKELVGEHLSIDDLSKIQSTTHFKNDLGADSLDVIELVLAVEQEFDIDIEDDYASHIATIQDALDYLKQNHNMNV